MAAVSPPRRGSRQRLADLAIHQRPRHQRRRQPGIHAGDGIRPRPAAVPDTAIYYWRASAADPLPATAVIYNVATQTFIPATLTSFAPTGSSGWIKALPASLVQLAAGTNYKVAVLGGGSVAWYSSTAHYWDTGPGAAGITNGPLTAYNNAGC